MRALIFVSHDAVADSSQRAQIANDISDRMRCGFEGGLNQINVVVPAEDPQDWKTFLDDLEVDPPSVDFLIVYFEDGALKNLSPFLQRSFSRFRGISKGAPIIACVENMQPDTTHILLDAGAAYVVDGQDDEATLASAMRAVVASRAKTGPELKLGPLSIDLWTGVAASEGGEIRLSVKEREVLLFMARHKGHALGRQQILDAVWDRPEEVGSNVVDVFIGRLRYKLNMIDPEKYPGLGFMLIRTTRAIGYLLADYDLAAQVSYTAAAGQLTEREDKPPFSHLLSGYDYFRKLPVLLNALAENNIHSRNDLLTVLAAVQPASHKNTLNSYISRLLRNDAVYGTLSWLDDFKRNIAKVAGLDPDELFAAPQAPHQDAGPDVSAAPQP